MERVNKPYKIGEWIIDPDRSIASRCDEEVRLEPKTLELLNYFVLRPGEVISRSKLLDVVWPEVTVGDEVITNTIAKLRRTFRDNIKSPEFIQTIPKRGYRLVASVNLKPDMAINDDKSERLIADEHVSPPNQRAWMVLAIIAASVLTAAILWSRQENIDVAQVRTPIQVNSAKPTIVVLPFVNMSDDDEQEYFSDGLTEDLIIDLSKISALNVVARTSAFAYKGNSPDVRSLARALKVNYVVEGSVRKAEGKIRITAKLIEASTGKHLWSERYDRDFDDIFILQDEVRDKIVAVLALKLTPAEQRRFARHISNNPEAYDLYLKGLQQESFFTREGNKTSIGLFKEAIELDPSFAAAHSHLAQAYSLGTENRWTETPAEFERLAVATAREAVRLDDELPYAYWSLGRIYSRSYVGDLEKAKSALEKSVALNPNYADGHMFLAQTLVYMGNAEAAFPSIEKAMRLNPHFPYWYLHTLGTAQYFLSNYEAAVKSFSKSIERNPTVPWMHRYLIASYGQLGMREDAEWQMVEFETLGQPATIKSFLRKSSMQDPLYQRLYSEGLRKAGLPED